MAKNKKKIIIMTKEEVTELRHKARGRAVYKSMKAVGQHGTKVHESKKRKKERKRIEEEDHNIKRGDYA